MGLGLGIAIGVVVWVIIAIAAEVFAGREAVYGVGLAALISLVLGVHNYNDDWEGTVERLETRRVRVDDGDGDYHHQNRLIATIRRSNGKRKEMHASSDWAIGDRLIKRRGKALVRQPAE